MIALLPILLYVILFIPYIPIIPGNDGGLEYLFAYQWYLGQNLLHILSLHPPLKLILYGVFFKLFGYESTGYMGLLFGIAGIYALYIIAKKIFDKKIAILSAVLLASSGLYLSVGVMGIHDFLMTVLILIAYAFYLDSRYVYYAIFISLAVLTKETAFFFAASILASDIFIKRKITFAIFVPLIILAWYVEFVHFSGYHLWNDWNFSQTAKDGSVLTMAYNLVTLQLFNEYAYENWLHLFVFNFNWVLWIFAIISFSFIKTKELLKTLAPIFIFFFIFLITVLSFQTFTINRYILPLLPFLYLFASFGVSKLPLKPIFIVILLSASLLSLSQSVDPVSNAIWRKTLVLTQSLYLNQKLDGDDGITYNMQYLSVMKTRTNLIKKGDCGFPHLLVYDSTILKLYNIHSCK
jgi:4-amino-4-deoxy-L-arabinose transferase-like glycosyltransferase